MAFNSREQLATIPVVGHETTRLVHVLRSWPQSYWSRPAYCPGWTAADAVAHLTMGGDFYAQVITAGRSGEAIFPWGVKTPEELREVRRAASKNSSMAALQHSWQGLSRKEPNRWSWRRSKNLTWPELPGIRAVDSHWSLDRYAPCRTERARLGHAPAPRNARASVLSALPALLGLIPEMQLRFLQQRLSEGLDGV